MADHDTHDHTGIPGVGGGTTSTTVDDDPIWDAAGDLVVGTGANAAARLPIGSTGEVLTVTGGTPTWEPNAGPADILDLPTAETNGALVLAPDGVGGVEFRAESGGGGGGGALEQIDQTVLASPAADITFTGIPNTYSDLVLVVAARSAETGAEWSGLNLRMGDGSIDTGTGYNFDLRFWGTGTSNQSAGGATFIRTALVVSADGGASRFGSVSIEIPRYADSAKMKQVLTRFGMFSDSESYHGFASGQYTGTVEIDQVQIYVTSHNLAAGTVATLYGRSN
jgi:hypothetical protein